MLSMPSSLVSSTFVHDSPQLPLGSVKPTASVPALSRTRKLSSTMRSPRGPGSAIPSPSEADAVTWANDTEFGLVSYVYTRDLARGLRVSEALEAGMVGLNRGLVSDPAAPFGGVKQSGIGREGAHEGLLEFTETKYIATNW